ncbi:MAG: sigma 54-interacting transcriptional regulator [Planctomycetales bacterium]|nr:sigma 54-interacting transcriptional regulator [Planctomycetales bacterium]
MLANCVSQIAPHRTSRCAIPPTPSANVYRALYHYSRRKEKPFLAINCAALSESLLESELFGHERGAFTGADQRRIGKFEQVTGGTILLDEVGDMSAATQAKALRLLQQQQFERVGGNVTIQTDVRVIAATNRNIVAMVEAGQFRRDLFYRLNVFTIHLPPLRDRREDIPLLATNFLRRLAQEAGQSPLILMPDTIERLQIHHWPGNVRELESAIKYSLAHATGDIITPDCLPTSCRPRPKNHVVVSGKITDSPEHTDELAELIPAISTEAYPEATDVARLTKHLLESGSTNLYREIGTFMDKAILAVVMKHVAGNQQQAAELLGISRMTLRNKLRS